MMVQTEELQASQLKAGVKERLTTGPYMENGLVVGKMDVTRYLLTVRK